MAPDTYLFDLDGTLTDPQTGIVGCIQYALRELGEPVPPVRDLLWCIGPPLVESFEKILGEKRVLAEEAVRLYRVRFKDVGMFENVVYDGIPELLTELKARGTRMFVCTSKPKVFADVIVDHFKLRAFFGSVYGSELDGTRNHKSDLIRYLLESEKLAAAQCLMIGDRKHDVLGAKANGVRSAGILWGYGSREELTEAGADFICARIPELARLSF